MDEKNLSPMEKAEQLLKKLEAENLKFQEMFAKQEKVKVEEMFAGKANGAEQQALPKQEVSNKDFAKSFQKGLVKLNSDIPFV